MVELPPAKSIHLLRVLQTDITDGLAACRRRDRLPGKTCELYRKPHQLYVFIDPGQENPSLAKPVFSVFADGYQRLIRFSNRGNIAKRVNFARLSCGAGSPLKKGDSVWVAGRGQYIPQPPLLLPQAVYKAVYKAVYNLPSGFPPVLSHHWSTSFLN